MFNQLKVEGFKMRKFGPFYASLGVLLIITLYGVIVGMKPEMAQYYSSMYDGFKDSIQDISLVFLIGMLVAWYVGIDFTQRTIHRSIQTGCRRWIIVVTRLIATSVLSIVFHFGLIIQGCINFGKQYGVSFEGFNSRDILWFAVVALQIIALVSLFVMITFIIGNMYSSLFTIVSLSLVGGNIFRNVFRGNFIYEHSFICFAKSSASSDLIPCAICAIIAIVVFTTVAIIAFNKKNVN